MIVLSTNPSPALPLKWKSVLYATYMANNRRWTSPSFNNGREMNFVKRKKRDGLSQQVCH